MNAGLRTLFFLKISLNLWVLPSGAVPGFFGKGGFYVPLIFLPVAWQETGIFLSWEVDGKEVSFLHETGVVPALVSCGRVLLFW